MYQLFTCVVLKPWLKTYLLQETFPNYPLKALVTPPAVPSYKDKHNIFSYFEYNDQVYLELNVKLFVEKDLHLILFCHKIKQGSIQQILSKHYQIPTASIPLSFNQMLTNY